MIRRYRLPAIPDPGMHALAAAAGGDVRSRAFAGAEQLLRMLAALPPDSITAAIRFTYDPHARWQSRLSVELSLRPGSDHYASTVERLVESGPLAGLFVFEPGVQGERWPLPEGLHACCDVVRREDALTPEEDRRLLNDLIPEFYYNVRPFEAKGDNTWALLDRQLDRMDTPMVVEVAVVPATIADERLWHYRYETQLMQINQLGDDLSPDAPVLDGSLAAAQPRRIRDPMADEVLRDQEDIQRRFTETHLHFAVRCWAASGEEARLVAATVAESALGGGRYRLVDLERASGGSSAAWQTAVENSETLQVSPHPLSSEVWDRDLGEGMRHLVRMSRLATVDELKGLFRLPVGSAESPFRTIPRFKTEPPVPGPKERSLLLGDDLELGAEPRGSYPPDLGSVFEGQASERPEVRLKLTGLTKHMFIAGVPGSGKTTAMNNLITQLAYYHVPFLVIEPAKTEYRLFKALRDHADPTVAALARDLRLFTVGSERISPFRFNPLAYPDGISLDEHIGAVLASFAASMPLEGPMLGLLAEAVEEVYAHPPAGRRFPRLRDLLAAARRIVESKGYSGEIRDNLSAALDVRLGMLVRRDLGRVFDCDEGIPSLHELFTHNVVLEMDYLTSEHACLVTLMVLSSLREHIRVTRTTTEKLVHVTFIEEAHNIVGRSGDAQGSGSVADPRAFAAQYVARMLAEVRALGEGMVIADQLPSAVAPEVVKNTGTKLAHRLVANQDREELGGTMLLDEAGIAELARLTQGDAFLYSEGFYRPRRIKALGSFAYLRLPGKKDIEPPPSRSELPGLLAQDVWYLEAAEARCEQVVNDARPFVEALESRIAEAEAAVKDVQQAQLDLLAGTISPEDARVDAAVSRAAAAKNAIEGEADRLASEVARVTSLDGWKVMPTNLFATVHGVRRRVAAELEPKVKSLKVGCEVEGARLDRLREDLR